MEELSDENNLKFENCREVLVKAYGRAKHRTEAKVAGEEMTAALKLRSAPTSTVVKKCAHCGKPHDVKD